MGSTRFLGTVMAISFALVMCFFFAGISSSVVMLGIVGAVLADSRSKRMLLDREIILAGAMR